MDKKIRKAVRSFLIKEDKIIATKYKTEANKDYYDIPGGKIEENESSAEASIREFKEETGMNIINQKYKGNVIIEYPTIIFDIDVYIINDYEGKPLNFPENDSMWIHMGNLFNESKTLPSVDIIRYLELENINLKIFVDTNHNILKIENRNVEEKEL